MELIKTRLGILKKFRQNIIDLNNLAKVEDAKRVKALAIVSKKEKEAFAAEEEAKACRTIAAKIEELISA